VKRIRLQIRRGATLFVLALTTAATAQSASSAYERAILAIQEQIQSGNIDKARALLVNAQQTYPANGGLENLHGIIAVQKGDSEEAKKEFSKAIRHSPQLTSAYLNLGRIYVENTAHDPAATTKALGVYQRALAITPDSGEANYYAALLLMRTGKFALSMQHLARLRQCK
jgi:Flp pilus assembly protein TadD